MKKTLKATAAIIICCLLMVVVVIYTPKPETLEERRQRREEERKHRTLTSEALMKANEAVAKVLEATKPSSKKVRFNGNTPIAINGASTAVLRFNIRFL